MQNRRGSFTTKARAVAGWSEAAGSAYVIGKHADESSWLPHCSTCPGTFNVKTYLVVLIAPIQFFIGGLFASVC